jgi:hypothetical protein
MDPRLSARGVSTMAPMRISPLVPYSQASNTFMAGSQLGARSSTAMMSSIMADLAVCSFLCCGDLAASASHFFLTMAFDSSTRPATDLQASNTRSLACRHRSWSATKGLRRIARSSFGQNLV